MMYAYNRMKGTNVEVRVEIEAQPRGARQSSLSSVLSSRSLSAESLDRTHSIAHAHSQDHLGHSHSREHLDSSHSQEYLCPCEHEGEGGEETEEAGTTCLFESDNICAPPTL